MAVIAIRLLDQLLPEWNLDHLEFSESNEMITHISGNHLADLKKRERKFKLKPSKRIKQGFVEYASRAATLLTLADFDNHQIAIYFHDSDKSSAQSLSAAIHEGFKAADAQQAQGVAMVPQPTSEAWFICATKNNPYQHCEELETSLSGNDRAADHKAPKKVLSKNIGKECSTEVQKQLAEEIDLESMSMPSFDQFRDDMTKAVCALCGQVNLD